MKKVYLMLLVFIIGSAAIANATPTETKVANSAASFEMRDVRQVHRPYHHHRRHYHHHRPHKTVVVVHHP